MKVTVIGSGAALPSARRRSPALAAEAGGEILLFDCGPDALHGLARAGFRHQEIDRILVTHFHPDHTLGLPHFLFASRYDPQPRAGDLWIAGPEGLDRLLDSFRAIYPGWLEEREYRVRMKILSPRGWETDDWKLTAAPVLHNPESLAYRLEDREGRVLVYGGDTGPCDSLVELAREADLLVLESSLISGSAPSGHLSPETAGTIAQRAGAKRVLLTHFYPASDKTDPAALCRKVFEGETIAAEDGLVVRI